MRSKTDNKNVEYKNIQQIKKKIKKQASPKMCSVVK